MKVAKSYELFRKNKLHEQIFNQQIINETGSMNKSSNTETASQQNITTDEPLANDFQINTQKHQEQE